MYRKVIILKTAIAGFRMAHLPKITSSLEFSVPSLLGVFPETFQTFEASHAGQWGEVKKAIVWLVMRIECVAQKLLRSGIPVVLLEHRVSDAMSLELKGVSWMSFEGPFRRNIVGALAFDRFLRAEDLL